MIKNIYTKNILFVGWLCFTSHRQRGHLEMAPPFTVPCKGHGAQFLHRSHQELNPGPSRGSPLHYLCTTQAPLIISHDPIIIHEKPLYKYKNSIV